MNRRSAATLTLVILGAGLLSGLVHPAAAQEGGDDVATADVAGEWLSTSTVTKVKLTGSFEDTTDVFRGQINTGRTTLTANGKVGAEGQPNVSFNRSGASITYKRTYPDGVQCQDDVTGEVKESGPAFAEFTLEVVEAIDGVAQRLSFASIGTWPNPGGECDPGDMVVHRTGEWVRVDGASAVARTKDGAITIAVAVNADPLRVAAGDSVSVPVTVSGLGTALSQPCDVPKPLARPLTLDSIVLATFRGSSMVGTAKEPLNPEGTTIDVGSRLDVSSDEPERCSHRMVAETTATITVPPDTAPGRYPIIPLISGLPRNIGSADSGKLVLRVVAAPPAPPTEDEAGEAPAVPPPADTDTVLVADTAGDVGGRAALLAVLFGAAAAMFSNMRGRKLRAAGIFAGVVALGGGAVELVAGGLLGSVEVSRHLASGALSSMTGAAMVGGFAFFLPWLSRPGRDERRAGPLIPVLLGIWVFALRAIDGADLGRAAMAGGIALVIGLLAVMGGSRTRARLFGLVGGVALMVLTYLGAVMGDGSGTDMRTEAIIALALGGAAVLVAALVPKGGGAEKGEEEAPAPAISAEPVVVDEQPRQ